MNKEQKIRRKLERIMKRRKQRTTIDLDALRKEIFGGQIDDSEPIGAYDITLGLKPDRYSCPRGIQMNETNLTKQTNMEV